MQELPSKVKVSGSACVAVRHRISPLLSSRYLTLAGCAAGAEGSNGALGDDGSDLASAGRESVQGFQLAGQRSID
jgi:hypothetical protein